MPPRIWTALLVALALSACGDPPDETFRALAAAARAGDREAFLERLTPRSQILARGFLAAAPEARPLLAPAALTGDVTVLGVSVDGDRAEVTARGSGGPPLTVVLLREDGRWGVDLVESQRIWGRARLDGDLLFDLR